VSVEEGIAGAGNENDNVAHAQMAGGSLRMNGSATLFISDGRLHPHRQAEVLERAIKASHLWR
jgi:hypothetical protein